MRAYQYETAKQGLELKDLPIPSPKAGEVLLEIHAAGLCHSDVHIVRGQSDAWLAHKPITLGHEVAGRVVELGTGVSNVQVGDRVVVGPPSQLPSIVGLGDSLGLGRDGGYGQFTTVTAERLIPLPNHVSFAAAAVSTDSMSTAFHAVVTEGQVNSRSTVAIIGLGGLGLSGALIAVLQGAVVYGIDLDEQKFAVAIENGVVACHKSLSSLQGVTLDVVIDFAGVGSTTSDAIAAVKPTGRVVLVGLGTTKFEIDSNSLVLRNVSLRGSLGSTSDEYISVLRLISEGKLVPLLVEIPFDDVPRGLDLLEQGKVVGRLFTNPNS
ncbi:hypothetical protein B0A52_07769 [Exophiala mesophila]|uniref:Enoyl reductase (ER) domain-containing protein n=1 Tax=Exophiala mesophila TaxID=212818 RepID=A0A438MY32_EXOME|nr:hypothetical protein B0A52_07769 [Exophiala mesophila]